MGPKGSAYTKGLPAGEQSAANKVRQLKGRQGGACIMHMLCGNAYSISDENLPGINHLTVSGRLISKYEVQKCGVNLLR